MALVPCPIALTTGSSSSFSLCTPGLLFLFILSEEWKHALQVSASFLIASKEQHTGLFPFEANILSFVLTLDFQEALEKNISTQSPVLESDSFSLV